MTESKALAKHFYLCWPEVDQTNEAHASKRHLQTRGSDLLLSVLEAISEIPCIYIFCITFLESRISFIYIDKLGMEAGLSWLFINSHFTIISLILEFFNSTMMSAYILA